jgi:hypothetical protein
MVLDIQVAEKVSAFFPAELSSGYPVEWKGQTIYFLAYLTMLSLSVPRIRAAVAQSV